VLKVFKDSFLALSEAPRLETILSRSLVPLCDGIPEQESKIPDLSFSPAGRDIAPLYNSDGDSNSSDDYS
jgi:hypothetical protein